MASLHPIMSLLLLPPGPGETCWQTRWTEGTRRWCQKGISFPRCRLWILSLHGGCDNGVSGIIDHIGCSQPIPFRKAPPDILKVKKIHIKPEISSWTKLALPMFEYETFLGASNTWANRPPSPTIPLLFTTFSNYKLGHTPISAFHSWTRNFMTYS